MRISPNICSRIFKWFRLLIKGIPVFPRIFVVIVSSFLGGSIVRAEMAPWVINRNSYCDSTRNCVNNSSKILFTDSSRKSSRENLPTQKFIKAFFHSSLKGSYTIYSGLPLLNPQVISSVVLQSLLQGCLKEFFQRSL